MKALCICDNRFRLYADSSVHRNNQPVFLPDIEGGWSVCICPAIRISRLGMHISEKFAPRYFDSVSVAALFVPAGFSDSPVDMPERFFVMDSAFATGEWLKAESPEQVFIISTNGVNAEFSAAKLNVAKTIAELSSFMTFKMGDILIYADKPFLFGIKEGDRVSAAINGTDCIDIKIK